MAPTCSSRSRIWRDNGGCAIPSLLAARPKCRVSASIKK
ncbi:Uncharacterised protein [Bordetella pertussis]|nr:Uncharacterised protein [Bordetella pertussis]